MTLGDYVKQYRESHGISQRKFAQMTGLTNTYISYLENNKNNTGKAIVPSIETYNCIASAMGITTDELVSRVDGRVLVNAQFSPQEQSMIYLFRKASERDKKLIMDILAEYDVVNEKEA